MKIVVIAFFLSLFTFGGHSQAAVSEVFSNTEIFQIVQTEPSQTKEVEEEDDKTKKNKVEDVYINASFYYGLILDLTFLVLIILTIYYPNYKKTDTVFTFVLFNVIIYLLIYFLNSIKISTGAAFGLFAVFTLLRYRTISINMRDMTYLFIFIAMGLLAGIQLKIQDILIIYGFIYLTIILLDSRLFVKREFYKELSIQNIEYAHIDKRDELIDYLNEQTGLNIHRTSIKKYNLKNGTLDIKAYYYE